MKNFRFYDANGNWCNVYGVPTATINTGYGDETQEVVDYNTWGEQCDDDDLISFVMSSVDHHEVDDDGNRI